MDLQLDDIELDLQTVVSVVVGITRFRLHDTATGEPEVAAGEVLVARCLRADQAPVAVVMDPAEQSRSPRSAEQAQQALERLRQAWAGYRQRIDQTEVDAEHAREELEVAQEQLRSAQHTIAKAHQVLEDGARERTRAVVDLRLALDDIGLLGVV